MDKITRNALAVITIALAAYLSLVLTGLLTLAGLWPAW